MAVFEIPNFDDLDAPIFNSTNLPTPEKITYLKTLTKYQLPTPLKKKRSSDTVAVLLIF